MILFAHVRPIFRRMRRTPVFSVISMLALAIGFGVTAALLALLDHMIFQAAPYPHSSELVAIWRTLPGFNKAQFNASAAQGLLESTRTLEATACMLPQSVSYSASGQLPRNIESMRVSSAFFQILRQRPLQGRLFFAQEEDRWGGEKVVIVSEEFWNREGRDPGLVGRSISLNGLPHTVVGILPKGFTPPTTRADRPQMFVPLAFSPRELAESGANYELVARLAPGTTRSQAQAEGMSKIRAMGWTGEGIRVQGLRQSLSEKKLPILSILLASAILVLLAAASNLTGLFLARGIERREESALRSALGATRWQITLDMLREGLVISMGGGMLGLILAHALFRNLGRVVGVPLDLVTSSGITFLATGMLTFPVALVAGAWPAWRSASTPPREALGSGSQSFGGYSDIKLRRVLVCSQIVLATTFLVGAVTLFRSMNKQSLEGPGFPMDGLYSGGVQLPQSGFADEEARNQAWERLIGELQGSPGILAAGLMMPTPLVNTGGSGTVQDADRAAKGQEGGVEAWRHWASPGLFPSLGQPLLKGRSYAWDELDACVVSLPLATGLWPGENPLGKRLNHGKTPLTVVGLVAGSKEFSLAEPIRAQYFISSRHFREPYFGLLVRFNGPRKDLDRLVGETVRRLHPDIVQPSMVPFEHFATEAVQEGRTLNLLSVGFSGLVLFLASLGLAGSASASAASRLRDLGMRAALGASPRRLLVSVLGADALIAAIGMLLGIASGAAFGTLLHNQLFGVGSLEPQAFLIAMMAVGCAMLAASLGPGLRILKLDPSQALRKT